MGRTIDKDHFEDAEYSRFSARLRDDLTALAEVLARPGFGEGPTTLGAELELALVDERGRPLPLNRRLLAESLDPRLTLEIDRFNLEYNLTPVPAAGRPFDAFEREMREGLDALARIAAAHGGRVASVGILPTLEPDDLESSALTDLPRYRALSAGVRRLRRPSYTFHIDGEDPLDVVCSDVTLEGANTSFQLHLRVAPADFAATYNAAQLATPVALALGTNSPVFLGHRLWEETRIALFKKSMDVRDLDVLRWRPPARVSYGHGWVREGALELFRESVALFPPLMPMCGDEDAAAVAGSGGVPALDELRLHQGTVWRWNRAIYDADDGGHLRIEFRALPAGPTPRDMVASGAFLIGLTMGLRDRMAELLPAFPFAYAEHGFYRAAQGGLEAMLLWPGENGGSPREIPARHLAASLLPVAADGLAMLGVDDAEIASMLAVIRGRLATDVTGSRWQRNVLAQLERRDAASRADALAGMLECYLREGATGRPVHEWSAAA
jgi:hypothetical protein